MAESTLLRALGEPARGPSGPARVEVRGWLVDDRSAEGPLRLVDCSSVTKFEVQADPTGALAGQLAVAVGESELFEAGIVGASPAPGEWHLFVPGATDGLLRLLEGVAAEEFVTVVEVTHGRALLRLSGLDAPRVLSLLCGLDLSDAAYPSGRVTVAPVAGTRTLVLRDDVFADELSLAAGDAAEEVDVPSYLLCCDRSSGQWLAERIVVAGAPFGLELEGYAPYRARRDDV
ncbi:MAG: hypothetical protein GEV08_16225 [Acidimicrobiia bacterium]|nr:hypothetical protein [Acidimicrobiia bacterium]